MTVVFCFERLLRIPRAQKLKPKSDQEENELAIFQLRQLCESKQKSHVHIGEAPQVLAAKAADRSRLCVSVEDSFLAVNQQKFAKER